jgi:hypothetical protein
MTDEKYTTAQLLVPLVADWSMVAILHFLFRHYALEHPSVPMAADRYAKPNQGSVIVDSAKLR